MTARGSRVPQAIDRANNASRIARRRLLKEVRAFANTSAWIRYRPPTPASTVFLRPGGEGRGTAWPSFPPKDYLGQLTTRFQAQLASERAMVELEDCDFYHTSELANGVIVPGAWDLRGHEDEYLGEINLGGERVLELGPASGGLTFHMEDEGAKVVGFDVGFDVCADVLPHPDLDMRSQKMEFISILSRVQNSWWFVHRDRKSRAQVVYGNIYSLPGDIGNFDTSVFGAILLHLRDPFKALEEAAARTTRRIVVTDALQDPTLDREQNLLRFGSAGPRGNLSVWWTLTPGTVQHMLNFLGFDKQRTSYSFQKHHLGHDMSKEAVDIPMFTVVGERG